MAGIGNLIHEVSTSTGTGNMTVTKVIRSFDEEFGASSDEDVFWYFAWNNDVAGEWEIGTGHKPDATTFVRDTVVASSNSDALVDWSAGAKHITNDLPAERQVDSASLGTAAATDASAYATAAQGAKADSALQSFDVAATVHAATGKSTPVDADELGLVDSAASNALKKLTWSNLKSALKAYFNPREVLTANRTYYVDDSAGNDGNDGLATGSGRAFKTIQKAIDTACALDLSIYSVTINVADGEYSGAIVLKPYLGTGPIAIVGNTSSPQNCLLKGTGARISAGSTFVTYEMRGFETQTVTSGNSIALNGMGILKLNNWRFGACAGSHLRIDGGARLNGISGSFTISGSASYFAIAGYSATIDFNNATITLASSVTFTATAYAQYMALVNFQQATFALGGYSVTGKRYNASGNSLISSGGGGASFIPGSTSGAVASGGTYL